MDHYPVQAALGIAVVLIGAAVALSGDSPGTRLAAATLVVTVTWMGMESVVCPHRLGSLGTGWGWVAVGWATPFLLLALHRAGLLGTGPDPFRPGVPPAGTAPTRVPAA